jgi:hypothetical protein
MEHLADQLEETGRLRFMVVEQGEASLSQLAQPRGLSPAWEVDGERIGQLRLPPHQRPGLRRIRRMPSELDNGPAQDLSLLQRDTGLVDLLQ